CGPERRSHANRRRRVLRIWRLDEGFATYNCARCGESGHTRNRNAPAPDPARLARARAEAAEREQIATRERHRQALWIWRQRRAISGTVGERYLREARAYRGPLPSTLGFLPAHGEHPPA